MSNKVFKLKISEIVAGSVSGFSDEGIALIRGQTYEDCSADPSWNNVVLMMHMDQEDSNPVKFIDETGKVITAFGGSQINNTQSKFGDYSGYFNGSNSYLTVSDPSLALGTGDFTVEFWFRPGNPSNGMQDLFTQNVGNGFQILLAGGKLRYNKAYVVAILDTTTTFVANTWYHVALVRKSGTTSWIVNGSLETSVADANDWSLTFVFSIGGIPGQYFNGYIDELRVTKGVARYDSNPTKLLLHFDQQTGFTNSANQLNGSISYGSVAISDAQKKIGNTSCYFNGGRLAFGGMPSAITGDFTIAYWYFTLDADDEFIIDSGWTLGTAFALTGGGNYVSLYNASGNTTANIAEGVNTWVHYAWVRTGTTLKLYKDGINIHTATLSGNLDFPFGEVYLGMAKFRTSYDFLVGYMDEVIISKSALYTENFTPPLTQYIADSNTILLCHFEGSTGGLITDVTGKAVTVYGNASISAAQSRFGGYSGYFDGSGDFLTVPASSDLNIGTGDFTIECWIYPLNVANSNPLFLGSGGNYGTMFIQFRTAPYVIGLCKAQVRWPVVFTGSTIQNDTWTHLAIVRRSGLNYCFVNGVSVCSPISDSTDWSFGSTLYVGTASGSTNSYSGYIDELRITKGVALYSAADGPVTSGDVLLMHFDQQTGFIDETGKTLTTVGTPSISTSVKKIGDSSLLLNDSSALKLSSNISFPDDFTIECWFYQTAKSGNYIPLISSTTAAGYNFPIILDYSTGGKVDGNIGFFLPSIGACASSGSVFSLNTWNHVALVRTGITNKLYLNGNLLSTLVGSSTLGIDTIGQWSGTFAFIGYVDEVRISNTARYTANFTPSLTPFTVDGNTQLLCHFEGSAGGMISEATGKTVTTYGNTTISNTQSKFGGYSGYFPIASSIMITAHSDLFLANSDFTIEFWLRVEDNIPNYWCDVILLAGSGVSTLQIAIEKAAKRLWSSYGNSYGTAVVVGTGWKHIAIVNNVSGNTFKVYVDGVQDINVSSYFQSSNSAPCYVTLGTSVTNEDGNRYIDELRISKGIAHYTANFTPPVAPYSLTPYATVPSNSEHPLPPVAPFTYEGLVVGSSNPIPPITAFPSCRTDALVVATSADITFDSIPVVDPSGSTWVIGAGVTLENIIKKSGVGSYHFTNGNDSYVYTTNTSIASFGSNDFTIESWVYLTTQLLSNGHTLFCSSNSTISAGLFWQLNRSAGVPANHASFIVINTTEYYTTSPYLSANTWHHVAVVRQGNSLMMFINGVLDSTHSIGAVGVGMNGPRVTIGNVMSGYSYDGNYPLVGYLDNFRITKGIARYTSNFTPA